MNESIATRHILAPVDLGDGSRSALRYVRFLAKSCGARVTIFYAHGVDDETEADLDADQVKDLEGAVRSYVAPFFEDLRYDVIVASGDPAVAVPRTARVIGADLIVMGTLGRKGAERAVAGVFA